MTRLPFPLFVLQALLRGPEWRKGAAGSLKVEGYAAAKAGEFRRSAHALRCAVFLDPWDESAAYHAGVALEVDRRYFAARGMYATALCAAERAHGERSAEAARGHHNLAMNALFRSDPFAARRHAERAVAIAESLLEPDPSAEMKRAVSLGAKLLGLAKAMHRTEGDGAACEILLRLQGWDWQGDDLHLFASLFETVTAVSRSGAPALQVLRVEMGRALALFNVVPERVDQLWIDPEVAIRVQGQLKRRANATPIEGNPRRIT